MGEIVEKKIIWRSMLYVPTNNLKFIEKANRRGADAITRCAQHGYILFWVICLSCVSAILCCLWRFGWLAMAHDMSDDSDEAETQARRGQ